MIYDVNGNELIAEAKLSGVPLFPLVAENSLIRHQAGNSKSAFTTAYTNGYRAMEGDVRFTSDSVPIMSHDATLGGLTISNSTLAQLENATTVYKLDDWLLDCKKYNVFADIDFTKTYTKTQCGILVQSLEKIGMTKRASIECYIASSAIDLSDASEGLILNPIGMSTTSAMDSLSTIASKCALVICTIPHADATSTLVKYAHDKGYLAKVWTGTSSDTKAMVEGYLDMGADQVITDTVKPSDIVPS